MSATNFMDKQIMELSGSSQPAGELFNLINPQEDCQINSASGGETIKNDEPQREAEILPSYDFHPIRAAGSSSLPMRVGGGLSGSWPTWDSVDSKLASSNRKNAGILEQRKLTKVSHEKEKGAYDTGVIAEVDTTVKKYADNLMNAMEEISSRLSKLESRTQHLENSVDKLKLAIGNNSGSIDGRLTQIDNVLKEVLYRFLDYYSKFDWESYCVSLQGPISTFSLPELVVVSAYSNGVDLLFSKEFLKECADMFSVPPRYSESSRIFSKKHLNIVDPLKPNNNLGRSVSRGNFYRIRSSFTYGARKLGQILLLPTENIAAEVRTFFTNTLGRHGSREMPDIPDASPRLSDSRNIQDTEVGSTSYKELNMDLQVNGSNGTLYEMNNIKILDLDDNYDPLLQFNRIHSNRHLDGLHECDKMKITEDVSILSLDRDVKQLAAIEAFDMGNIGENHVVPCHDQIGASPSGEASHASHLFFYLENGCNDVSLDRVSSGVTTKDVSLNRSKIPSEKTTCDTGLCPTAIPWFKTNSLSVSTGSGTNWNSNIVDCFNEDNGKTSIDPKCIKLSDLVGDFSIHYANLRFALSLNQYTFSVHGLSHSQYQNKYPWNAFYRNDICTHLGVNGLIPTQPFSPAACYPSGQSSRPGVYGAKDMQKPRGTGTYFPDTNSRTYRERLSPVRGKNQMYPSQLSGSRNNGRVDVQQDRYLPEEGNNSALSQPYSPVSSRTDSGKPASSDMLQSSCAGTSFVSGSVHHLERKLEFGSLGPVPLRVSSSEQSNQRESVTPCSPNPATTLAPTVSSSSMSLKCERAIQHYQLKDESDFPPL